MLKESLNDNPRYQAVAVGNGAQALALVQQARTDLILLDLTLPGMDGAQLYDLLQADPATHAIPVLFVTADPADDRLRARGVPHVLAKPFDLNRLLRRVAALLADSPGA